MMRALFASLGGHGTVSDEVLAQDLVELCFVGAADLAVQFPGAVGIFDLAFAKQALLFGYCGKHRVTGNGFVSNIRVVNI